MSLRDQAIALYGVLNSVLRALKQSHASEYPGELASILTPIVADYDEAVFASCSSNTGNYTRYSANRDNVTCRFESLARHCGAIN